MRSAIILLLTGACTYAQQQGSIEGTAINALTHEPLSNVHVRLIAATFGGVNGAYGAMSDRAGHFSIATIRPGTYILLPERPGFLHVQTKGSTAIPTITIKPGQSLAGYELEMSPRAVIVGRVVDESGDPVQAVRVQAIPVSPEYSPAVLNPAPNPTTDDRGEFRIISPAGKFYLQATLNSPGVGGGERPEARSDGTTEAVYGTTFYPSSLRKDRATVVEAIAGKDVAGLEIRLARQQQGLSISGVVSAIPEGSVRPYVIMQWGEKAPNITNGRSTNVGADGKFKFESLQPGYYRILAQYNDGKTSLVSRMMEWTLENTEVSNVELPLTPGLQVSGKVRMEGDPPGSPAARRTVKLEPMLGYNMGNLQKNGGEVDADGLFRMTGIMPGRYRVRVEPLPEGAYVKTVEIDGTPTAADLIDLSNVIKSVSANITLGHNAVFISGRVLDAGGDPIQTSLVMIYLVKDFSEMLTGNGTVQSDSNGTYTLKSVAPGKYKLFAIDALRVAGGGSALDVIRDIFNRAEEVELKEGEKITKDLKVMSKEDPNAKKK